MPVLKGVMGYTRFLVKDQVALSPHAIAEKLNMFGFKPLHARGEDAETVGWCSYLSEYDWEKSIEVSDFLFDKKVVLCMRIDTISLPKGLLKSMVKKSVRSYMLDHKKMPDKTVRKEIELAEVLALRARILPQITLIESVWCQETHELRLFTRSKTKIDRFLELFQQTFLMRAERKDFAFVALEKAREWHVVNELENITHLPVFIPPMRIDVQ